MNSQGVSIVVCANCGHDHPLSICIVEGATNAMCGCREWAPILKPFAGVTPPKHEHEHWGWKVLAWAALIGLFAYALVSKGGI